MFMLEHVPASPTHPEEAARGSQSCASVPVHVAWHDEATSLPTGCAQQTVLLGQLAALLHLRDVVPLPPTPGGQAAPPPHAYVKSGGGAAGWKTQHMSEGIAHVVEPQTTLLVDPPGPASGELPPSPPEDMIGPSCVAESERGEESMPPVAPSVPASAGLTSAEVEPPQPIDIARTINPRASRRFMRAASK
jgi:hypothetical protein